MFFQTFADTQMLMRCVFGAYFCLAIQQFLAQNATVFA